jgi:hypothetical protein
VDSVSSVRKQAYDFLDTMLPHPLNCEEDEKDDARLDAQVLSSVSESSAFGFNGVYGSRAKEESWLTVSSSASVWFIISVTLDIIVLKIVCYLLVVVFNRFIVLM